MNKRRMAAILIAALGITIIPQNKCAAAVYNGWELSNGSWYYYRNGSMCTGWVKDGQDWYYLKSDGSMQIGWLKDKNTWYYLNSNGSMATGWIKDAGNWYYLNSDGSMHTGWIIDENAWYYLNPSGSMATGWIKDGENWYYLNNDGTMRTGEFVQNGKEYYLDRDGAMKTGWFKQYNESRECEVWYYAESDGSIKKGWLQYKDLWYYLTEDGSLASNINVDGYYINKDGVWDKSYDDKVILATAKESYNVNEKNIAVKLINNTDNTVKYRNEFSVETYENGQWVKIGNTKTNSEGELEVSPNSLKITTTDFIGFRDKIKEGKYRLGTEVNGEYIYSEFELTGRQNEGRVEINTEKNEYYLNEVKTIPYIITNNTYGKITYDSTYKIYKDVGGKYVEMKLKNADSEIKNYELNDGESAAYSISLSNIDEKLMPGNYRIAKKINGEYIYESFELSNDNIAEMRTDKHYYFNKDENITLTITNETDHELSYGNSYRVEKWEYEKGWLKVPLKDDNFTEEAIILKPHEKNIQIINISNINEDEMYGDYRIVKEFNGNEVYAEFSYGYALGEN